MSEVKNSVRRFIKAEKAKHAAEMDELSEAIIRKLETDADFLQADTVLLYYSLPDEVDTHRLASDYYKKKRILLPVVKGEELELRVFNGKLVDGTFHIQEPCGAPFYDYDEIELAVIPGMAFDRAGHRLGRGKGYYDRLLPQLKNTLKIGLCFPFQLVDEVPTEPTDIPMDKIITL